MRKNYQRGLASKLIHSVKHDAITWNADVVKNELICKFVSKIACKKRRNFRSFTPCGQHHVKFSIDSVVSINPWAGLQPPLHTPQGIAISTSFIILRSTSSDEFSMRPLNPSRGPLCVRAERKTMAFGGRRGFGPGLFLIVASSAFACVLPDQHMARAAEAETATSSGSVIVAIDRAKIVKLPERTATLVIGNPLIADAVVQPGGIAVITAKSYGATNLVALDRTGATLLETPVQVVGPADKVVVMYRGVDRETYSCAPNCERRMTIGDAPVYFTANLNQIGTFGALAQGTAGGAGAAAPVPR